MTVSLEKIADAVTTVMGKGLLKRRCRERECVRARWLAFWVARRRGYSLPSIGRHFGYDHTTVLSGARAMTLLLEQGEHDEDLRLVEQILMAPLDDPKRVQLDRLEAQLRLLSREIAILKGAA